MSFWQPNCNYILWPALWNQGTWHNINNTNQIPWMWTFLCSHFWVLKGQQSVLLALAARGLGPLVQAQAICLSLSILNINGRLPYFNQEIWLRFEDVSFSPTAFCLVGDESLFLWILVSLASFFFFLHPKMKTTFPLNMQLPELRCVWHISQ